MRVPVPRSKGNQGSSRWIGRRNRGRSLSPPVRGRPALRHPPLFQGGFEDRPSTAIAAGFLSREISIAAKHTDREFRVARVLRGIRYGDHHFDALMRLAASVVVISSFVILYMGY